MGHLSPAEISRPEVGRAPTDRPPKSNWWIWVVVIAVALGGFWYYRGTHAKSLAAGAPGSSGFPGAGGFPGGVMPAVPVVVTTALRGDLPVYFDGLGTVTAYNTVTVRSRVDGAIVKVNFTEGQFVHEGEPLVEIDPRPYQVALEQAQGQLAKDQAQLKDVQIDMERYKLLFKEGVIPQQQVDTQEASVGQSKGSLAADQAAIDSAKLNITYSHIVAPISGRVGLRLVDTGNIVHATDTNGLVVITQLQPISVIFTLPQDQLPQVMGKLHSGAQLSVEAWDRDDTAKIASGKLATIDNQIDVTTGTYKLKAIFSNDTDLLFPNQFVNVHLLVDTKHNMTLLPVAAIERGPQGTYVYASGPGNVAKIQAVTIAQTTGNLVALTSGVKAGDSVVIDGQDKLQDGTKINPTAVPMPAVVAAAPTKPMAANGVRSATPKNSAGVGSAAVLGGNSAGASAGASAGTPVGTSAGTPAGTSAGNPR
jgi:multidrug efflux system membrane fusion protein